MTLTIELKPALESQLKRVASDAGIPEEEFALRAIEERLEMERRKAAIALLQSWIDEGDEEEMRETGDYLRRVLDEDRLSDRKLFP